MRAGVSARLALDMLVRMLATFGLTVRTGLPAHSRKRLHVGRVTSELVREGSADRQHLVDLPGAIGKACIALLKRDQAVCNALLTLRDTIIYRAEYAGVFRGVILVAMSGSIPRKAGARGKGGSEGTGADQKIAAGHGAGLIKVTLGVAATGFAHLGELHP